MNERRLDGLELRLKQLESDGEKAKSTAAMLAGFHVAEYSAMMARVSAWANLQYAPWPILAAAIALVTQVHAAVNVRMWMGVILTLVLYVAYQGTMVSSLYYVLLIEKYLRPRARDLVGTDEFWIHERVFQRIFPPNPAWWPYWPPVISLAGTALMAGLSVRLYGGEWVDVAGGAVAVVLGVFIVLLTGQGKRLKDEILETCTESKMVIDQPKRFGRGAPKARQR